MEANIQEIWVDIIGYEGLYQISNLGRVKSLEKSYTAINKKGFQFTKITHERILKHLYKQDYPYVSLSKDNKGKFSLIHRLLAVAFIPNPLNKKCINHKDRNRRNFALDNLEWVTHQENRAHYVMGSLDCKSKYLGVRYLAKLNKWEARMYINGIRVSLGTFDLEDDAGNAYKQALIDNGKLNKYA